MPHDLVEDGDAARRLVQNIVFVTVFFSCKWSQWGAWGASSFVVIPRHLLASTCCLAGEDVTWIPARNAFACDVPDAPERCEHILRYG